MRNSSSVAPPKTVDDYLQRVPPRFIEVLARLRQQIVQAAPVAEELISYQIPTYKYKGALVHFAAFKNHCSFFGVSKEMLKTFEKELQGYKTAGTTIHFTEENPLPAVLVKKIVRTRIRQNEELSLKAAK